MSREWKGITERRVTKRVEGIQREKGFKEIGSESEGEGM